VTTITATSDGNTPLSPDELAHLIPNLPTKEELNEWERENILLARDWAIADRTSVVEMASDEYIRKLHGKMFDQTWKWGASIDAPKKTSEFHSMTFERDSWRCSVTFAIGLRTAHTHSMR
jgi:hypothetical protein